MSTTTGGTETSNTTTFVSTSLAYGEILSNGGASTPFSAIQSPTGKGWIYFPGVAGTFANATWTAKHTHSAVSHGVDCTMRFYKYSAGTYTSIGQIVTTQTLTAKTTYTNTGTMPSTTLTATEGIYVDLWWHDNNANIGGDNPTNFISNSGTAGVASDMEVTTSTFTPSASTVSRTVPASAALQSTLTRTITSTAALQSTLSRTIPATAALSRAGIARTIPATAAIANTFSRTIPSTASLSQPVSRTVPATAALLATISRTIPSTGALQSLSNPRTIIATAALLATKSRTVSASTSLVNTVSRTVPASAALKGTLSRTIPSSASLIFTISRTIPATVSLTSSAVFYASNVASTVGGLTQSDQMSQVAGGTETSFTVTMPASGTNSYAELRSQGGTSSGTPVLPSPTGRGWSIALAGNTILAGSWSSVFTLAKSGTSKTGASLVVRYYRRTMDGTVYPIGVSTLTGQTFSTTKTTYIAPSVSASWPFQFIAGDTLYMDAFVFNAATAWASDVFTVYVSNSATQGVYNDGIIISPMMIATPAGLTSRVGATAFQTGDTLPILNQSISLADAIDQRSILTFTGKDVNGTLSYQRAMPVQLSDSDQGLLYTGAVNSDKVTKHAAGDTSAAELAHLLTFMDNHYLADKRANVTNYLNWSSGDMICDFIQSSLSQEGITGKFALESDYTPTTFAQGTLSGTVATTTTSPFTYAPNTATPPITSNTGDLELTRAGTKFTLTESATSDFASGTLTNMVASNNQIAPSTQSAIKVTAQFSPVATAQNVPQTESGGIQTNDESLVNSMRIQVWSGSKTVSGGSDTFNYDVWISSTSPAFMAGMDIRFSDGTFLINYYGTLDNTSDLGLFDQNGASVDRFTDFSAYAKDAWYTRNITLTGLSGKTITEVHVYIAGSSSGTYTVYYKNCYLGSQSGSPFFSTSATSTQLNPPIVNRAIGGYLPSTVNTSVVQVYNPLTSYRVSSAHSISGVGLVQNSNITWTASLPSSGAAQTAYPPGTQASVTSTSGAGTMALFVSYDGNCWLQCQNGQALPGLPAGANVSGLSLYLREQFAAGSDPSAIPALLNVQITINSAAAQTVSDIVTAYGTSTQWNTGTQVLTNPDANGHLTLGGSANPLTRNWNDNLVTNQTLLAGWNNDGTEAATGGTYTMTTGANPGTNGAWCQSRLDFAGYFQNGTIECDVKRGVQVGIEYRQTGWGNANNNGAYLVAIQSGSVIFGYGANNFSNTDGTFTQVATSSQTVNSGTFYHLKIVVNNNRHTIYFNNSGTPAIDVIDNTYPNAGQIAFRVFTGGTSATTGTFDNFSVVTTTSGIWTSPGTSLTSLGSCGYNQVCWTDLDSRGQVENTTTVLASVDNGSTWMQCVNGAEIPQLARGTSTSGMTLKFQMILYSATPPISTPVIMGLYARICGNYGTVTGTRISPVLNLSTVGYVASSNVMYNANVPTNTSVQVQTTQDLSTYHTVGNSGAGEALTYWTNQPDATQDLFATNTLANYTNINKSGGSVASVVYETAMSRLTLAGGSGGLYVNLAINTSDVDLLCDMDRSDAGGIVLRFVDTSNYLEVGVYDASSSGGFTNQLRLYKVASGTRTLLGSASSIVFTRGTFHRIRVTISGGLINVYWDGQCKQSYLDTSPLGAGACGLRNDGGTSRYYQLWIQPLGTNLSGQKLQTKVTMTTSDPSVMPQLFTLVACVRGPSIATGATISQLHSITKPFAAYYSTEIDSLVQSSGDFYGYVDKWRELHFGPRLARPGAFPIQSVADPAGVYSGYLLYQPQVSVLSSSDLFRNEQIVTNVSGLVTPPAEIKTADGSTTSWSMGYPLYSAPVILINGQSATVGLQGVDANHQFYWQPGSPSISYDSSLPKLPAGTVLSFTYVGESTVNVPLSNSVSQIAQASLELNSGIVSEIQSALNSTASGMTTDQATTFGNGLLSRYGNNGAIELVGTTRYTGLVPGTTIPLFLNEIMRTWNAQLPVNKVTTTVYQGANGLIWLYSVDATNGANVGQWQRMFYTQ